MNVLNYTYNDLTVALISPLQETVQKIYAKQLSVGERPDFPFWSKVWASSTALSRFLVAHPHLIKDKNVFEIAGGLGLPSLVAAHFAARVYYSDYLPEPVEVVKQSVALNGLTNLTCHQLNWANIPGDLSTDVLLLSDINYNPADFECLMQVLTHFINQGTVVILSTPQRLMGKAFIERLMPWKQFMEEVLETEGEIVTTISIIVLSCKSIGTNALTL